MFEKYAADTLLKSLDSLQTGTLSITMPDGKNYAFQGKEPGPAASLFIEKWCVPANMARSGDVGMAEDYRHGLWQTDNLENLMTLALQNETPIRSYIMGNPAARLMDNLSYFFRRNTLKGSRSNIYSHYDLGNEFYKLWLDPTMTYSSAIFNHPSEDLIGGQFNKYDRIIDSLTAKSGSVLEVGCGWGGFAERAADRGDYKLTGVTLSPSQREYAARRLKDRASIVLEDYRTQQGVFDNIVSIEMFEAVGQNYWPVYFNQIGKLLKKGGRAVIQTITIEDSRFDSYRRGSDFIRSFIFPGGMLPSPAKFEQAAGGAGLKMRNRFDFGQDYARTLELWLQNFDHNIASVRALGFDEGFIRLWRFYLSACIAAFRTGRTNVMQVELSHA